MDKAQANDLRDEIAAIRQKVEEQGAVADRTLEAVGQLADSVAGLVSQQRRSERSLHLNSFVAYLLFTVLLGGGFFLLYSSRADRIVADHKNVLSDRDQARAQLGQLQQRADKREVSAQKALDYYGLLRSTNSSDRSEAISRFASMEAEELSPTERTLFEAEVKVARTEVVDGGYLSGIDAFRQQDYDKATTSFLRGLAYEDQGPRAAQMRYYLGVSLHKQGDHEAAVRNLELALAARVDQLGIDDARFHLAAALEDLGKLGEARTEYDRFASTHPQSLLAPAARRRSVRLRRPSRPQN